MVFGAGSPPSGLESPPGRERASRLQRKLLGDCHPHSIATLQNLVSLYSAKGDAGKKEAMEFLVKALQASAAKPAV